mmetsp:Transcript_9251/g.31326  ORF Transcript_9251/g.31326 Transcript_9251/m.31326 type:complete len:235 (-) Transcript_9251:140-844(-)
MGHVVEEALVRGGPHEAPEGPHGDAVAEAAHRIVARHGKPRRAPELPAVGEVEHLVDVRLQEGQARPVEAHVGLDEHEARVDGRGVVGPGQESRGAPPERFERRSPLRSGAGSLYARRVQCRRPEIHVEVHHEHELHVRAGEDGPLEQGRVHARLVTDGAHSELGFGHDLVALGPARRVAEQGLGLRVVQGVEVLVHARVHRSPHAAARHRGARRAAVGEEIDKHRPAGGALHL